MLTFDTNKVIMAKHAQVLEVLTEVLNNQGWGKVEIHSNSCSLTAELLDADQVSPKSFFVIIATCVPLSERTELFFSISTNNLEYAESARERGDDIVRSAIERLENEQYTDM
jgi:hypothetical protein